MNADTTFIEAPLSKVVEMAREYPSIQASIGWAVLICACDAGILNLRELLSYIKQHGKEQEL